MRLWSKGLGRMTLTMDFNNYYAEVNDGTLYIKGKITDPVYWNFVITIHKEDIPGLANILFKRQFLKYLIVNIARIPKFIFDKLLHRDKFAHPEKTIEIVKD
jgi:hypothetical protein